MSDAVVRLGLVGARGHTGAELLCLVERHPRLQLAFATSRSASKAGVEFEALTPEEAAQRGADVVVLALPNGNAAPWVAALSAASRPPVIVDLSADGRFDPAWAYGLPERFRARLRGARRIANPGCYATGIQLGIAPMLDLLAGTPTVFGVSGYSGAGTTPSDRNDPAKLEGNVMPYALTGHLHEREASEHLGRPVFFTPHVAPFFRGITLTISLPLASRIDVSSIRERYVRAYDAEPLVRVVDAIPLVRDAVNRHDVTIGGFAADAGRAVVIVTLDNLLKGAATQAIQNVNLALGVDELTGILA